VRGNEVQVEERGMVLLTKNRSIWWREIGYISVKYATELNL